MSTKSVPQVVVLEDAFGPLDERSVTKSLFERALSKNSCEPFLLHTVSEERVLQKSEIVQEIYILLETNGAVFPPDTAMIRFKDIDEQDDFFLSAQALTALGVLQVVGGTFGEETLRSFELERMLGRAFVLGECGFLPNEDIDGDGILNEEDSCINVPGTLKGRPIIPERLATKLGGAVSRVNLFAPSTAELLGFSFHELTDIQLGDLFRAVLRSPRTGKNLSESTPIQVRD